MSSRLLVAYLLIVLLVGGIAAIVWRAIHNSERNVRRRARRERRAKQKERLTSADDESPSDSDS